MSGVQLIAAERKRQVELEHWTAEHDAGHVNGEIAEAAAAYALHSAGDCLTAARVWPFGWHYKPRDPVSDLVRAGALIAAEIDRLLAAQGGS